MKPNIKSILNPEVIACVRAYLLARAHAEATRQKVDAYIQPIFELYTFKVKEEWAELERSEIITSKNDLYLCGDDELVSEFYAECDREHRKQGYNLPAGYCPALVAESLLTDTENILIAASGKGFDVTNHKLLCSGLEARQKWIDLVVSLVVQSTGMTAESLLS